MRSVATHLTSYGPLITQLGRHGLNVSWEWLPPLLCISFGSRLAKRMMLLSLNKCSTVGGDHITYSFNNNVSAYIQG
jgi:hypothetical protein